LLEAINIASGDRKNELYERLAADGGFSAQQFDLLQLLNPKEAGGQLKTQLLASTDDKATEALIRAANAGASPEFGKALLEFLVRDGVAPSLKKQALAGLNANLNGSWKSLANDPSLKAAFAKLLAAEEMQRLALRTVGDQGLKQLDQNVIDLACSTDVRPEVRKAAIDAAMQLNSPQIDQQLRKLLDDSSSAIRESALLGLIDRQDWKTVRDVLTNADDKRFSPKMRTAAIDRLFNSTGGALLLLKLIEEKQIGGDVKDRIVSKAVKHPDANVRIIYEQFIPPDQRPKKLGEAISAKDILALDGDSKRGEEIFMRSSAAQCKSCHRVQRTGGRIGPDLTLIGRKYERATLLETILDPSKAIAPEYVSYIATLSDGRRFAGFIADRNDQEIILRDAQGKNIHVPVEETELTPQTKSMMPELVLRDITSQDAADLLAYLMTLK
jgi:putative heme-binding domain-containing protein